MATLPIGDVWDAASAMERLAFRLQASPAQLNGNTTAAKRQSLHGAGGIPWHARLAYSQLSYKLLRPCTLHHSPSAETETNMNRHSVSSSSDSLDSTVDDAFDIDLEDTSKTRSRGRSLSDAYWASMWISRDEAAALVVGAITMVLLLDPPFVIYFLAVVVTSMALTARMEAKTRSTTLGSPRALRLWVGTGCGILVAGCLLQILQPFEIEHIAVDFELPALASNDSQPSVTFFRMYNPNLVYSEDVEAIHGHLNNGIVKTQRLAIDPSIDVWASDVVRYEFLRRVWQSTTNSSSYRVMCIAESDVVYDEQYIANELLPDDAMLSNGQPLDPLELAHVQHFWGHRVFEPFNIALLCTSSRASLRTQLWAKLASFLHRKRYRRLLPLDLLYGLVPKRLVLYWDAHHGCTEYDARCKYIHFTQPKLKAIIKAFRRVQEELGANL